MQWGREWRRTKDRSEEAERNRKHESEIAKIYTIAFVSIHQTGNHNQLLPFHAPQGTATPVPSPTELSSPGLTPPYSLTSQSDPHQGFLNELNNDNHPNMALLKAWQAKKQKNCIY